MRARTIHSTRGRVSSSRGCLEPHPPDGIELSTGTPRGSCRMSAGVEVPGVEGGVKAGDSRESGGGRFRGVDGGSEETEDAPSSLPSWGCADCAVSTEGAGAGLAETEKSGCATSTSLSIGFWASVRGE